MSAYIPHLEVLESHRGRGLGSALVQSMLELLGDIYMIDLMCDADIRPFYEKLGLTRSVGMIRRNYSSQSGL